MRMRVREIIKMHLDSGMIRLDTPVIIMDLPAGKKSKQVLWIQKSWSIWSERPEDVNGITEPVSVLRSKEKRMYRRSSDGTGCKISDAADIVRCIESTG